MVRRSRQCLAGAVIIALTGLIVGLGACSSESGPAPTEQAALGQPAPASEDVPLVTMRHWKESTPGERYAFIIGFVTMLELEKEWQGRDGYGLLPFERSLVGDWVEGFAHRPLSEIYNGLNAYLAAHPGDQDRPTAEVMWFTFVKPRLDQRGDKTHE